MQQFHISHWKNTELTEHIFKQPERLFPTKGKCHAYVQTE